MSKVVLSSVRMLLRSVDRRQFSRCGRLRLASVTTFALHLRPGQELQHRTYASSLGDDGSGTTKTKEELAADECKEISISLCDENHSQENKSVEEKKEEEEEMRAEEELKAKDVKSDNSKQVETKTETKAYEIQDEKAKVDQEGAEKSVPDIAKETPAKARCELDKTVMITRGQKPAEEVSNFVRDKKIWAAKAEDKDNDLSRLTLEALKARLRARGLSATGRKQILIERLQGLETTTTTTATVAATEATTRFNLSPSRPGAAEATTSGEPQLVNYEDTDSSSSSSAAAPSPMDDVSVEYVNGMPHMTVRLPSRNEMCQFALKPITHNVGDLLSMLKVEDRGIDRAAIINKHGVRIASSCSIDSLLDDTFSIQINNRTYEVNPPKRDTITLETIDKMGDVRKVIAQLYEAFNVGEYQLEKGNEIARELETIRYELEPLEEKKSELSQQAARRTNIMTWMGLGLMSVQFGILARLTWWEYSWDIMEPVTYFVTYGTTMAMYAYYCVTKREYLMEDVKNREYILTLYKNAKKQKFDVDHYNQLKRRTAELEYNLRRLQDPLNMQLPPHLMRLQNVHPPTDEHRVVKGSEAGNAKST